MKLEELKAYREQILAIAKRHHVPNTRVFWSVDSDVDFLVDVAQSTVLNPLMRDEVLKEAISLEQL